MFVELTVENVAIIERSQVQFGPGLTVLTGETGAGKSLLVDAIELAIGERADSDLVRTGAGRAVVSLAIDVSSNLGLAALCERLGFGVEDGLLLIQREVFAEGRSQARIGGKLVSVSALKQLGHEIVDLHGQHDHQSLLHPDRHIDFLDAWIGAEGFEPRATVTKHYAAVVEIRGQLHAIQRSQRDSAQRADMLRFQIGEISAVAPQVGEMEDLESKLSRLTHAERLRMLASDALARLADVEPAGLDQVSASVRGLEEAQRLDPSLDTALHPLREALYSLQDGIHELRAYAEAIEADPEQLEVTAARIDALKRLRTKYGDNEEAVIAFWNRAEEELATLEDPSLNEEELTSRLKVAEEQLMSATAILTRLRTSRALEFAQLTERHLKELAIENAIFRVEVSAKEIDSSGEDEVQFYFSANAGEVPKPLAKIASGGEISRVMLAIKSAMAETASVPTLIFDEVDVGLSGRAAAAVAKKLAELARHCQVITISHLPQIASVADAHFRIEKTEVGGRVATDVVQLSGESRVEEIARMLAGETISATALEHAKDLLTTSDRVNIADRR